MGKRKNVGFTILTHFTCLWELLNHSQGNSNLKTSNLKLYKIINQSQILSLLLATPIKARARAMVTWLSAAHINDQGLALKFCSMQQSLPDFLPIAAD